MNRDDIIRMARETDLLEVIDDAYQERDDWHSFVERFAALVAAAEREACAEICETAAGWGEYCSKCGSPHRGDSPTGMWCNSCGNQNPCNCWNKTYCSAHDLNHVHEFDDYGYCKGKKDGCAARLEYQRTKSKEKTPMELAIAIRARGPE